ncbi:MAG: YjbQ family protein [Myxococcales bacterium]|nr:YjbQ family protein [Myxococcales bacterium]
MIQQTTLQLPAHPRGFHLVTPLVLRALPKLPSQGILHVFLQHTSAGLAICENADPDVRVDLEGIFNRLVPEDHPDYVHTLEGSDDMPSHAKSILTSVSLQIPITENRLNLGTWQGIYLCEFRDHGGPRRLVLTVYS